MTFLNAWALLALIYWLVMLIDTLRSKQWMLKLPLRGAHSASGHSSGPGGKELPLVSVIIAAKEEEASIVETVKHLMNQTYPRMEIIAVNDRSQDTTGRRLDELRRWSEGRQSIAIPLRIIHITSLPSGWVGKNHALYQGYLQARGSYLLFTDADVRFQPHTVRDSVEYMLQHQVDHLTLAPRIVSKGFWLSAFVQFFFFTLCLYLRPWRANDDFQHRHGMGIGAFNLVTRHGYERIGTHKAIARRPDDDLQLGALVKRARLRQRLASGRDHLEVEWYASLREAVRGLEKNMFSGFGYSVLKASLGLIGQLGLFLFPLVGLLTLGGWAAWAFGLSALMLVIVYLLLIRSMTGQSGREVAVYPVSVGLLCYVVARSVWLTLKQGGVYWRGTFYTLDELKRREDS